MKLATERTPNRDGRLLLVSRDLSVCVPATGIAETMQDALDHWEAAAPALAAIYSQLNAGTCDRASPFRPEDMAAPLPRAWQWLDGSAYPSHGALMQQAFSLPPIETADPLMYQGLSHCFLGAGDDVLLPSEDDGIDFEGELGIVTSDVPMGTCAAHALDYVRLIVQINDWSLRTIAPIEMKTGFGWIQAKPACSMAPVAITPDELGNDWRDGRVDATLEVRLNGRLFGKVPTFHMEHGFDDLIAHAARTRRLCAGTIIGSGTVSSADYRLTGSCCLAERRAIETLDHGIAQSSYMKFGDHIGMRAHSSDHPAPLFGPISQNIRSHG